MTSVCCGVINCTRQNSSSQRLAVDAQSRLLLHVHATALMQIANITTGWLNFMASVLLEPSHTTASLCTLAP
jgi:hypothetical protein